MQILVGGKQTTLDATDILGQGGEATVYRLGDRAVKIFHSLDANTLAAKLAKLASFPRGLPAEVIAPEEVVFGAKKREPVGYAMPAVKGAHDLADLMKKGFRAGTISNQQVCELFVRIHDVLAELHRRQAVVGDLNDGNLLFSSGRPWFIDVDSMQLPGHPCTVAHERYLDPALYGADLSAQCCFTPDTDWYAFAVLLFTALLYVHPYGGVHPHHPTLLRRAQARASVFDPAVKFPKSADPTSSLPADLADHFRRIFDAGERGVFPRVLLEAGWSARKISAPPAPQPIRVNRTCKAIRIFTTPGRILAAAVQPGLAYLYEEDGVVRREDGARVIEQPAPGLRFAFAGAKTWVGLNGKVVCLERERVVERAEAGMFDATTSGCFVEREGWLMEQTTGARVGKVLERQTWFRVGRSLGFGFYRAGRVTFAFLFRPGQAGLIDVRLPPIDGRLLSADAVFDDRSVAVSLLFDRGGVRSGALYLIGEDGKIRGALEGPVEHQRLLASTTGRAVQGDRILASTEEGLALIEAAKGTLSIRTVFADTEPFVEEGMQILPGPNGSLYAITTHEIRQLELS